MIAVDVFGPIGQPSDCLIMNNLLPLARHIWYRDRDAFANVDRDVLRT